MKEESEKASLKLNIQKTKTMASGPIISWQIDGEKKCKQWQILFYWAPKSLWAVTSTMKLKGLLLGKKAMTNLDSVVRSRDITLPTKVYITKAVIFPVIMYRYESWTIKKAECWRLMLSNCGAGEDSWESLEQQGDETSQSQRKSTQNIHQKDWC